MTSPPVKRFAHSSVAVALSAVLAGCGGISRALLCNHSTESEAGSPRGNYIAEVILYDCGATEHATVVRIHRNGLFSKKTDLLAVEDTPHIRLSWRDEYTLSVDCEDCSSRGVQQPKSKWLDVTVQYKLLGLTK
jgi:hypothetical protein